MNLHQPCKVLLVEDDPGDAHLVHQFLRACREPPIEITQAQTLAEARQHLRGHQPDILLLDLSLPDSAGFDTVRAARQAAGGLPIVVLTGHDDTAFALQALEAGAQDYLLKGRFDTDALVRAIRYAIARSRLEQHLAETGDRLRTLIDALPDSVFFKDGEGRWLEANHVALELFKMQKTDYRGKKDSELAAVHGFFRQALLNCQASDEATWRSGCVSLREEIIPSLDGPPRILDLTKVPLFHADGRRKGLVAVGRDITQRKLAEEHQRLAARVFETTGEAIMITDTDARIVAVNPAFTRITGYRKEEVLGENPRILKSGRHNETFHMSMWQTLLISGGWSGEVWNRRKNGEIFPQWQTVSCVKDEFGRVSHYVAVCADLSEIRSAQQTAENLSWRDALTSLANRALFLKQLDQALANAQRENGFASVLLLDLDRFKDINEARGLAVGDALLQAVAERLKRILHSDDLLARLDSDEFAVLLPRLMPSREVAGREALDMVEKLRTALRESLEVNGEIFHLDASIGITQFPESPQETASNVLRQADMAMHKAKAEGGGRVVFFEVEMGVTIKDRYRLEQELRLALAENQLRLYLQPQVDATGRQVGAEALVRWQHPSRGLVPPGVFIPLAETTDLIVAIDRWMLTSVCRLLKKMDADYPPGHIARLLRVSVNISPRHFQKRDFVNEIKRQLAASGVAPSRLVLEITEGLVIGNLSEVVEKITTLTALGIHFSMDDFGTGYSSLAYLKRLPIHELKIDKSFIDDVTTEPNDAVLVETILAVTKHMNLKVVAEGVETQAQADFLNARGKVIHQGYLYGRPQPHETWLAQLLKGDLPQPNVLRGNNSGEIPV
ncbi:MAG: EAL domain-containing protein [Betaproteobacteria bacterium]|nr:EAL domain-containing protein [Betaproteobacteria bacterium]